MTTAVESARSLAREVDWVALRIRNLEAGEEDIHILVNAIVAIRGRIPPTSVEGELVARYIAVKQIETITAAEVGAHFWPLAKACTTEKEARELMARVPGGCVEKACMWNYFMFTSKVVPKVPA